ncbi:bifunctional glutamate N-acetyltransferase/amino-acid acetyltransferase ArgJ [Porticoccaceae bacterium]|nr:bifunctional glutamate N-acetyltransferase/amino-acid acetyltransferase ArgJ [Porticoccaceae bacterium]MDC0010274.1 bifunctional glutamate N-acetyltransferase/amino-acid acetyltransferase ArgJ [Porticoccaceae bacterium]
MATGNKPFPQMHPISGFKLGTTSAGIKTPGRSDLVVMELQAGSTVAGVFTQNAFCAAPVVVAKQHLSDAAPRYLVTNTGNANAGTGDQGMTDALASCAALAQLQGVAADQVLPFSTGVIGEPLPIEKLLAALPAAVAALDENAWAEAAEGILTTDTRAKGASLRYQSNSGSPNSGSKELISITGIAKGSGMIKPNMATMLGYVATDAKVDAELLQRALRLVANKSFNRITVDSDTSTNDAVILVATGASDLVIDESNFEQFVAQLEIVFIELAQSIIRDGEGASKFVTVVVDGALDSVEALKVAYTVAESPLVKTALAASDANWGRILAAVGRAGVENLDVSRVSVRLNKVLIAEAGGRAASYTEAAGEQAMAPEDITIHISLDRGAPEQSVTETIWTTDLTYEYVRINAEYRT